MAILKLKPSGKDYIWGGHKLVDNYGKEMTGDRLAETWELSCHPDGPSFVDNGEDAGKTLRQYIEEHGKKVLGTNCERFEDFPILTKFIDAQDNLSIQVHPDNEYALKNEGQYGKTEMWYVVDAEEGAYLYHGFKKEISKDEFRVVQDAANEKKVIRNDIITSKTAYEKQYQVFRKLLKASYKEITLSEIMDCINEIIIYPNKNITVKWAIEF